MQRRCTTPLMHSLGSFSTTTSSTNTDKIIASVLFERLPVVIPKIDPVIYAFQEFSFRWKQQYRRVYPDEFYKKYEARGKGDYQIDYKPASRITEADKANDKRLAEQILLDQRCLGFSHFVIAGAGYIQPTPTPSCHKSLQRALDRRLYLLLHGTSYGSSDGKPVWHFPEKVYDNEETLRKCAESALQSVLGDLTHTYFVGNAPMGHIAVQAADKADPLKKFFFKSQVISANKINVSGCDDYVWVTKDELLEYFPDQAEYLKQMIIS